MKTKAPTIISAVAVLTLIAAPALAERVKCIVTAPEIRVRQSPSMDGKILNVLRKDARVIGESDCDGGWVKVFAQNGRLTGYVAGWALADAPEAVASKAPSAEPAPTPQPVASNETKTAAAPAAPAEPAEAKKEAKEVPSNEQLAIQITEMRIRVLGLERNVKRLTRDVQKIKGVIAAQQPKQIKAEQ